MTLLFLSMSAAFADGPPCPTGIRQPYHLDHDGDGFGRAAVIWACRPPTEDHVLVGGDCNDRDANINPDALEVCDGADVDEDCDRLVNDDDPDMVAPFDAWYDLDGDGHGDPDNYAGAFCVTPSDSSGLDDDCDDTDASVNPDAAETADGFDQNCDGARDEGLGTILVFWDDTLDPYSSYVYPGTIWTQWGLSDSGYTREATGEVNSVEDFLLIQPTADELGTYSWFNLRVYASNGLSYSPACDGLSAYSADYTIQLTYAASNTPSYCRAWLNGETPTSGWSTYTP